MRVFLVESKTDNNNARKFKVCFFMVYILILRFYTGGKVLVKFLSNHNLIWCSTFYFSILIFYCFTVRFAITLSLCETNFLLNVTKFIFSSGSTFALIDKM